MVLRSHIRRNDERSLQESQRPGEACGMVSYRTETESFRFGNQRLIQTLYPESAACHHRCAAERGWSAYGCLFCCRGNQRRMYWIGRIRHYAELASSLGWHSYNQDFCSYTFYNWGRGSRRDWRRTPTSRYTRCRSRHTFNTHH